MKPLDLSRYIDPATNHLNGCSYLLLRRQLVPSQHGFLQRCAISQNARSIFPTKTLSYRVRVVSPTAAG